MNSFAKLVGILFPGSGLTNIQLLVFQDRTVNLYKKIPYQGLQEQMCQWLLILVFQEYTSIHPNKVNVYVFVFIYLLRLLMYGSLNYKTDAHLVYFPFALADKYSPC